MYQQNPYGTMPQQAGWAYGAQPRPRCTQPVTAEMSKMLHQQADDLSVKISKTDVIKNQCTHKDPATGQLALINNPDGSVTCRTCGETFHLVSDPKAEIESAVEHLIDILQTTKVMYLDAPEEFVKQYFQSISLLKNLPKIFEKASNNFSMYETYSAGAYPTNPGFNTFQAVNGIMNGVNPMMGTPVGYPQQPTPGYYYGAPMPQAYPQPVYQQPAAPQPQSEPQMVGAVPQWAAQPYGYQAAPPQGANPMAFGAPAPAPTGVPSAPQSVQAPTTNGEVTQTKEFKVN